MSHTVYRHKFLKNPLLLTGACMALLAGCAGWGAWTPNDSWKDPPSANGKRVMPMYRTSSCAYCPTGRTSQSALLANGRPFYLEQIGDEAGELVLKSPGLTWTAIDKDHEGKPRLFAPIRIIVPSIQPLVVMTIPWTYESHPRLGVTSHLVSKQMNAFQEREDEFGRNMRYIPQAWPRALRLAVEVRGSLPKETATVRIISRKSAFDFALPQDRLETRSVIFDGQKITFARSEAGTITVNFSRP